MSIESIIDDMESLEAQLEALTNEGTLGDGPDEILYAALKAQRFARSELERMEVYDTPGDDEIARQADYRQRVRDVRGIV